MSDYKGKNAIVTGGGKVSDEQWMGSSSRWTAAQASST
jgi:hypothetical protein